MRRTMRMTSTLMVGALGGALALAGCAAEAAPATAADDAEVNADKLALVSLKLQGDAALVGVRAPCGGEVRVELEPRVSGTGWIGAPSATLDVDCRGRRPGESVLSYASIGLSQTQLTAITHREGPVPLAALVRAPASASPTQRCFELPKIAHARSEASPLSRCPEVAAAPRSRDELPLGSYTRTSASEIPGLASLRFTFDDCEVAKDEAARTVLCVAWRRPDGREGFYRAQVTPLGTATDGARRSELALTGGGAPITLEVAVARDGSSLVFDGASDAPTYTRSER